MTKSSRPDRPSPPESQPSGSEPEEAQPLPGKGAKQSVEQPESPPADASSPSPSWDAWMAPFESKDDEWMQLLARAEDDDADDEPEPDQKPAASED